MSKITPLPIYTFAFGSWSSNCTEILAMIIGPSSEYLLPSIGDTLGQILSFHKEIHGSKSYCNV